MTPKEEVIENINKKLTTLTVQNLQVVLDFVTDACDIQKEGLPLIKGGYTINEIQ